MKNDIWAIKNSPPVAAGTGLLALDVIKESNNIGLHLIKAGGSFGNIITILSYLGWETYPIARLGNDETSIEIKNDISTFGVNLKYILIDAFTKTPIIIEKLKTDKFNQPKHNFLLSCPYCKSWFPRFKPLTLIQVDQLIPKLPEASVFYSDRLAPAILKLVEKYYKSGALIVFEPGKISDVRLFSKCLTMCHILKYHEGTLNGYEKLLDNSKLPLEIETLGSKGLKYRFKYESSNVSDWLYLKPYDVGEMKDTAGAGDWLTAGLIHILGQNGANGFSKLNQRDYLKAMDFSQALAAFACKFEGPRGVMYSLNKKNFMKNIELTLRNSDLEISYDTNFNSEIKFQPFCLNCRQSL
jgi:fructokinase